MFNLAGLQADVDTRPAWAAEAGPDYWADLLAEYRGHAVIVWTLFGLAVASFVIAIVVRTKPAHATPQWTYAPHV